MTTIRDNEIAAQAFRFLEMSPISSFDDDSEEAASAAAQYPTALRQCLEYCDWSFASMLADLPAATDLISDAALPYTFKLPGDCVRLIEVQPINTVWRLDSDALRTDLAGPLRIRYTREIGNATLLPAFFKTAVAYRLASLLSPRWQTSANRAEKQYDLSVTYLRDAQRADRRSASTQRYDGQVDNGDWVSAALR